MTDRASHVRWCKARALAEVKPHTMLASMVQDLAHHPETAALSSAWGTLATKALWDAAPQDRLEVMRRQIAEIAE